MRRIISSLTLIMFLTVSLYMPLSITRVMAQENIIDTLNSAIGWLSSNQNADGSWGTDDYEMLRTTSKVTETLAVYGLIPQSIQNAVNWLKNNSPQNNTDLARYLAVPGLADESGITQLVSLQLEYGGWRTESDGSVDNLTTCLAASLLMKNGGYSKEVTKAAFNLLSGQNTDGSWGMIKGENTGSIEMTGLIRSFLIEYQSRTRHNMSAELEKASQWLLSHRYADKSWGGIEASYMAFIGLRNDKPEVVSTLSEYFMNKQAADGSWNGSPYDTALAIDLLSSEKLKATASINDIKLYSSGVPTDTFSPKDQVEIVPVYTGRNVQAYSTVIAPDGLRVNLSRNNMGGFYWNCSMAAEGTYTAEVALKDIYGEIKGILTKQFKVKPVLEIEDCEIDITPGACIINKPIKPLLGFYIKCGSSNINKPVTVTCSVYGPDGGEVYYSEGSSILKTGDNNIGLGSFSPVVSSPSEYKVRANLFYEGKGIYSRNDSFQVLDQISSTYTSNSDFDRGIVKGLNHIEKADQLQLNKYAEVFPYIWIANAGEGTVSKLDTRNGREVARYRTGNNTDTSPSRTAVDKDGNCWVGNRGNGTVVKIAMTGGIDRNGNGKIDTSTDLNGNGRIEANEMLPWGQDEAILVSVSVGNNSSSLPRAVAIDKKGRIWVGLYNEKRFVVLNPNDGSFTGISVGTVSYPYGAVIDTNGYLWSSGRGDPYRVEKIDTNNNTLVKSYDIGREPYGIVVDKNGIVWVPSSRTESNGRSVLVRLDSNTGRYTYHTGNGNVGRGVAIDRDGNVWMACSGNNWVDKFDPSGKYLLSVNIGAYGGSGPIGVGVDSDGYVWVTCNTTNNTFKISASGNIIGSYAVGAGPYTYSDMTGFNLQNVTAHDGTWTVTHDSGKEECTWSSVSWDSNEPADTEITVSVKGANSVEELEGKPYTKVLNGMPISNVSGRFLVIEAKLNTANLQSPELKEIRIEGKNGVLKADAGSDISVKAASGSITADITLDGSNSSDPDGNKLTYKWSWNSGKETASGVQPTITLPVGTTEVSLIVNNGYRDSQPDTVMVTVSEDVTPPERPQMPENFIAEVNGGTQIRLSWSPSQNASYYEIEIDQATVNKMDDTTFVHSNLIPGSTHNYRVRAVNSKGFSDWTEMVTVTTINYADEIDRILKQVEEKLTCLEDMEIIQKTQELLDTAKNLMPKVSEGPIKVLLQARIDAAQDGLTVARIRVKLNVLEIMIPNISSFEPIKKLLEEVQLEVNNLPERLDADKKAFQVIIDAIMQYFSNRWYPKPFMESPKSKAAIINAGDKIYAIGGIKGIDEISDSIEEFNPDTNRWTTKASMPAGPRQGMAVAAIDGNIYVIGGKAGSQNLRLVEMYDPRTDKWSRKADMPTARQGAVAAAVNGKIYVIGGYNGSKHFRVIEEYDPVADTWSTVSKALMPTARDTAGIAVLDGKIYVIGGFNSQSRYLNSVEVYDPVEDKWEIKSSMNVPRRALGICQLNNRIYAIGGYNSEGDLGAVEVYDPLADEWGNKTDMTMKRSYLSVVTIRGSIYAIGGTCGGKPVNTVEEFIP